MSKHIKGPWRWDGNPCSYDASIEAPWLVSASNGADVILNGQIDCTSEEAARLIASAPELLEACEQAVVWLEGWASAEPYIGILRAAIAKATGGQQ